jgi:HEAT repeat protein
MTIRHLQKHALRALLVVLALSGVACSGAPPVVVEPPAPPIRSQSPAQELATTALHAPDPQARWSALEELGVRAEPDDAVALLRPGLDSSDDAVRRNAAVALSVFGSGDGLDTLHEGVTARDAWRRWEAINALGRVHDEGTVRVLAPVLLSPVARDREETALVLGRIGGHDALVLLVGALHDPLPSVRWRAALALGHLGDPAALPPLRAALEDEPATVVSRNIEQAIVRLTGR